MTDEGLTLDKYQRLAAATDVEADARDPAVPLLRLAGQAGGAWL